MFVCCFFLSFDFWFILKLGGFGHYDLSFLDLFHVILCASIQFEAALQCFDHFVGQMCYTDEPYEEV